MSAEARRVNPAPADESAVFDRALLDRYTMNIPELAAEVVELFLRQLPETLAMIERAATPADWKLATHTLKGSAASIGACRLRQLASELEGLDVTADDGVRQLRLQTLKAAAADFREAAGESFPKP